MNKGNKKLLCDAQLNSIKTNSDDPSLMDVKLIIHDFDKSWNNAVINKSVSESALHTLINKPICCQYFIKESEDDLDALGGHGLDVHLDRVSNEPFLTTNTLNIGVITNAYIDIYTDEEGNEKEVVMADGYLWCDKYPNIIGLINEWINKGLTVHSSVELLYSNFEVQDGIQYIKSPIYYIGHAILNSENRGEEHPEVLPAYDSSRIVSLNEWERFNKLVASALSEKGGEKLDKFKKVFELSHNDIRSKLYVVLSKNMLEDDYYNCWICDVYDSYFIYEQWVEGAGYKYYQLNYTKNDTDVSIDMNSIVEVMEERKWVKVEEVQNLQAELKQTKEKLEKANNDKNDISKKFNEAVGKLASLNEQIENLAPFKDKYEKEQFEKKLSEKKDYYEDKFSVLNAKDKFDTEEVQSLIERCAKDDSEAILELNSILVDLVDNKQLNTNGKKSSIKEFASKQEDLMPEGNDFDSRYSL